MFSEMEDPSLFPEKSKKLTKCSPMPHSDNHNLNEEACLLSNSITDFQKETVLGCLKILFYSAHSYC